MKELLKGRTPHAVTQGGTAIYRIIEAGYHPKYTDEKGHSDGFSLSTYDVGWFRIALPPGARLTIAPLANDAEIRNVTSGMACCYVGFPAYKPRDYARPTQVVARVNVGNIVRTMNFRLEQAEFKQSWLWEHNMYSWGGSSGSPIFNRDGRVVAVNFAGSKVRQQVGGAQYYVDAVAAEKWAVRVDKLRECLPD
jgi:hypothetical protein